jgi:hypothetical protein
MPKKSAVPNTEEKKIRKPKPKKVKEEKPVFSIEMKPVVLTFD